ncbi:hypothetical protein CASFOL_034302 [Castilleja foliolosa]|uniref:DUF4283 domain-containing protein n=1 Tax=Castilleja foliolosa TaxID=1961234 RepID=A0ABD3BWD1_9LAMI
MIRAWNITGKIQTNNLGDNIMAFIFSAKNEMEKVSNLTWTFRDYQMVIAKWPPDKALAEIDLDHTSFWVHVYGLPVAHINLTTAAEIGNNIGRFIKADLNSPAQKWKKSVRIQVEININQPLISAMKLSGNGKNQLMVEISKFLRL